MLNEINNWSNNFIAPNNFRGQRPDWYRSPYNSRINAEFTMEN